MRVRRRRTLLLLLLATMLMPLPAPAQDHGWEVRTLASLTVQEARGESPGIKAFVVVVSINGFNGTYPSNLTITVNEGDRVQITFKMDEEDRKILDPLNRHIIVIMDYEIYTEEINPTHPEATVVFLADKPGYFTIACSPETWDCPGHKYLDDLKLGVTAEEVPPVQPPKEDGPASVDQPPTRPPPLLKTELKLDALIAQCFSKCPLALTANLTDSEGRPVAGMPVAFNVNTTFGKLRLGSPYTNAGGIASVNYSMTRGGALEFTASFPGGGGYEASTTHIIGQLPAPMEELPPPLLTTRNVAAGLTVTVVLSVWSVYLFVLRQIHGIRRDDKSDQKDRQ